jgi:signal peptidase II
MRRENGGRRAVADNNGRKRRSIILGAAAAATLLVDQTSKWLILSLLPREAIISVIPGFFWISHSRNPWFLFGLGTSFLPPIAVNAIVSAATVVAVVFVLRMNRSLAVEPRHEGWAACAFGLILGGAVGNLVDRVFYSEQPFRTLLKGKVVDFLNFHLGAFQWPAFNGADTGLVVGIGIFFYLMFFDARLRESKQRRDR